MEHIECQDAERLWIETGEDAPLRSFLRNSLLGKDSTVVDVLISQEDKVKLSVSGEMDYTFSKFHIVTGSIKACLSRKENGETNMVIARETTQGIGYIILVDLKTFYKGITQNLSEDRYNEIVMIDADKQMLVHRQGEEIKVNDISRV